MCEEINRCLRVREKHAVIAAWINAHPDARVILDRSFHGAPITPTNLSAWKQQDGYKRWLQQEDELEWRVNHSRQAADLVRAGAALSIESEPFRVESAICGMNASGLPVLLLTINGIPAQVHFFTTKWLVHGMVPMLGGPPHSASRASLQGRTPRALRDTTDDPVVIELCRRLLLDWRAGNLLTGPREIPTLEQARAARWRINAQNDTIRREGGAVK